MVSSLGIKLLEHIYLAWSVTFATILIGIPLGILIFNHTILRNIILGMAIAFFKRSLALLYSLFKFHF